MTQTVMKIYTCPKKNNKLFLSSSVCFLNWAKYSIQILPEVFCCSTKTSGQVAEGH